MPKEERRQHDRYRLWLPARIEGQGDEPQLAVGHDMSQGGSLLVTDTELEVGSDIRVHVRIPPDAKQERVLEAKVLRCTKNPADPDSLWPYQIAVVFKDAVPELDELLREHMAVLEGIAQVESAAPPPSSKP
jgi:hypothetical protein